MSQELAIVGTTIAFLSAAGCAIISGGEFKENKKAATGFGIAAIANLSVSAFILEKAEIFSLKNNADPSATEICLKAEKLTQQIYTKEGGEGTIVFNCDYATVRAPS